MKKNRKHSQREYYRLRMDSISMEAYRMLQTNIEFYSYDNKMQVLLLTSSTQREGKSTTVSNLAVAFSLSNKKVLVIDLDLRKPVQHKIFNVNTTFGITTVLTGKSSIEDSIRPTEYDNLYLLPSGIRPPNPSELLRSESMRNLIDSLRAYYDVIIIDTPPVLTLTDAAIASKYADSVLMVASAGQIDYPSIEISLKNLKMVNANVIGCVMNNVKIGDHRGSYYYRSKYKYDYYY